MAGPKKTILLVEDEPHIVLGLRDALEFEGFRVLAASKGREGVGLAKAESPDAIILDLMLPDTNGYRVCELVRGHAPLVPILMLTARSQEADKIRGLDAGADDYVTKPFSIGELVARLRAIFRRVERSPRLEESFAIGEARIDPGAQTLTVGREKSQLSFYEAQVLKYLHERAGQVVSRDELLDRVWGVESSPTNRSVDNFIVKLRKKVEKSPDKPEHILTVYGYGYKLAP